MGHLELPIILPTKEGLELDSDALAKIIRHLVVSNLDSNTLPSIAEQSQADLAIESILSEKPSQTKFKVGELLSLNSSGPAMSRAYANALEAVIESRWVAGFSLMYCDPNSLNATAFSAEPTVQYEFMPTKILSDAVEGGLGKLLITFPSGAQEAEIEHDHPGGRIVLIMKGEGRFNCPDIEGGYVDLKPGMVVLMPAKIPHNFAANTDSDMEVISIHVGYVDISKQAAIHFHGS